MKKIFLIVLFLVTFSYLLNVFFYKEKENIIFIRLKTGNEIIKLSLEDYVEGVVAAEMPASFDIEALKAQAVASRTYALKKIEEKKEKYDILNDTSDQVYLTKKELKLKWKDNYKKNIKKIKKSVKETKGEYLTYDDEIIYALYFSTSSGKTENVEEVFSENLPYLRSVESNDDISEYYVKNYTISKSEFCDILKIECFNINIEILDKTTNNSIKKIKINEKELSGKEFVKLFNLKSTIFNINILNENVLIQTKGYGHGVGMSQYGAYSLALKGYKYDQILKYYYTNIEIKKIIV